MDPDDDVSRWILEFLLRDRDKEHLAKRALAVAPLSDRDWRLKKTILLRTVESQVLDDASVPESLLQTLESIEALDRQRGLPATEALKAAYLAVATECTVKFLVCFRGRPSGKYHEAVDRVWRGRVRALEEEGRRSELVTAELKERREEVEAGVWDLKVSKRLSKMNSRNDALKAVAAFVKEAMAAMGSPFIAFAARFSLPWERAMVDGVGERNENEGGLEVGLENEAEMGGGCNLERQLGNGAELGEGSNLEAQLGNGGEDVQVENAAGLGEGSNIERQLADDGDDLRDRSEVETQRVESSSSSKRAKRPNETPRCRRTLWEIEQMINSNGSAPQVVTVAYHNSESGMSPQTWNGVNVKVVRARSLPANASCGMGSNGDLGLSFQPATKEKEIEKNTAVRCKHLASHRRVRGARIRDDEDLGTDASDGMLKSVASAEVRKVQQELRSSVLALQAVVTDPLPDALRASEIVRSELESRAVNHANGEDGGIAKPPVAQPGGRENDAPGLSADKGKGTENVQTADVSQGNPSCSYQNDASRPGLMERNATARTYEWDDSLGMSPEGTTKGQGRLHLPIPKRIAVSPLKPYDDKRVVKRRKVKRWSLEEEETLRNAVQKYGKGNWKAILRAHQDVFEERTEVDLKDKWRNLTK